MTGQPSRIGIVGAGWRTASYLTVASARPDLFEVRAILTRTQSTAAEVGASWPVPVLTSPEDFFARGAFDFVIVCVPVSAAGAWVQRLAAAGVPVLLETPPASDLPGLLDLHEGLPADARVQVAEQYRFQPHHAARIAIAHSGLLGAPTSASVSVAHDYHAISLLRALLGIGFESAEIEAASFDDRVLSTLGREGWEPNPKVTASPRVTARLHFRELDVLAVYEFSGAEYFSPIRSRHIAFTGERGEFVDDSVSYVRAPGDAVRLDIARDQLGVDGNLEGGHLRRLTLGDRTVFSNPMGNARLSDDEIAIGTLLSSMSEYAHGGAEFYGLDDASHDLYLSLLIHEAVRSGHPVRTSPQRWSSRSSMLSISRQS
jgi:predicted dehydrogenase